MIYDPKIELPMRNYPLTEKEIWLIDLCRSTEYGEFVLHIEKKQPARVEDYKKSLMPPK